MELIMATKAPIANQIEIIPSVKASTMAKIIASKNHNQGKGIVPPKLDKITISPHSILITYSFIIANITIF